LPILAFFYSVGLLEVFQNKAIFSTPKNLEANKPSDIKILMYINDSKLIVSLTSVATNNTLLAKAYKTIDQWLWKAGLVPDQDKHELMHYT